MGYLFYIEASQFPNISGLGDFLNLMFMAFLYHQFDYIF